MAARPELGRAAVVHVVDVVGLAAGGIDRAVRDLADAVPALHLAPHRRGHGGLLPAQGDRHSVALDQRPDGGVATQPAQHRGGDRRAVLDVAATLGVLPGEDVVVDVHDHLDRRRGRGGAGLTQHRLGADPDERIGLAGVKGVLGRVEVDDALCRPLPVEDVPGVVERDLDHRPLVRRKRSGDPEHAGLVVPGVETPLRSPRAVALGAGGLHAPVLTAPPGQLGGRRLAGRPDPPALLLGGDDGGHQPHLVQRDLAGEEGPPELRELAGSVSGDALAWVRSNPEGCSAIITTQYGKQTFALQAKPLSAVRPQSRAMPRRTPDPSLLARPDMRRPPPDTAPP